MIMIIIVIIVNKRKMIFIKTKISIKLIILKKYKFFNVVSVIIKRLIYSLN